jgi:hypothetical protein
LLLVDLSSSEILDICRIISANRAAQCIFFTIFRMLLFQTALILAWTFRQLTSLVPRYIVSLVLFGVTRFTKVGVSPTIPLGNVATELTLELNEFCTVFFAVLDSCTNAIS